MTWVKVHGLASEAEYPYLSGHTSKDETCNTTVKPAASITGFVR